MQSFAFWYKEKSSNSNSPKDSPCSLTAVLNFNLWYECGWKPKRKNAQPILDIGFKIYNLSQAEELSFFLPFSISEAEKKNAISDLGCKFHSTELVDALFNESYRTTISTNSKVITVKQNLDPDSKDATAEPETFKIYQLDIEHDITLEPFASGTIIKIPTENITTSHEKSSTATDSDTYYLRFRIHHSSLQTMIHQYEPWTRRILGAVDATNMIDFRYNNVRSLDRTLIEQFYRTGNKRIQVKSLHFLLMTKAYIDVESQTISSVRKLETNVWSDYICDDKKRNLEDIVAYHHSFKPKQNKQNGEKQNENFLTSAEIFLKIRKTKTKIVYYVIVAVLISIFSSFLSSFLTKYIPFLCH